eukprot:14281168-Alexandrium_andersonii.AAC.1
MVGDIASQTLESAMLAASELHRNETAGNRRAEGALNQGDVAVFSESASGSCTSGHDRDRNRTLADAISASPDSHARTQK